MNHNLYVLDMRYNKLCNLIDRTPYSARSIEETLKENEISELSFTLPICEDEELSKWKYLVNGYLVEYNDEYYEIITPESIHENNGQKYVTCHCKHLAWTLQSKTVFIEEDLISLDAVEAMKVALLYNDDDQPTIGWSIGQVTIPYGGSEGTKYRTINAMDEASSFSTLVEIARRFDAILKFNSKTLTVDLLTRESANTNTIKLRASRNLKNVTVSYDTSEICTRLYPFGGADDDGNDIDILNVNPNGTYYIEDYGYYTSLGYTNEEIKAKPELFLRETVWRDSEYTNAQDLYDDAVEKMGTLAYPKVTVTFTALDLSQYPEFVQAVPQIGDTVIVIDEDLGGAEFVTTVVGRTRNSDEPHLINLEVTNSIQYKDILDEIINASNLSNYTITATGDIRPSVIKPIVTETVSESVNPLQEKIVAAEEAVAKVEESVSGLETTVTNAKNAADNAQKAADDAEKLASDAKNAADKASEDAQNAVSAANTAQEKADSAISKADDAKSTAGQAINNANAASDTAKAAKSDAEQAQREIDSLSENLTILSNTMQADYARKTDLTEAEAQLRSQISQNAAQISTTVSMFSKINETTNDAKELADNAQKLADEAQIQANEAMTDAKAAQQAAYEAVQAAAAAQSEANIAQAAANEAQNIADKAEADLAAAKADLATVESRADATEEEIRAAQDAVNEAQAAADTAKAEAETALSEATAAQTRADEAKTEATAKENEATEAVNNAVSKQEEADEFQESANVAHTEAAQVAAEAVLAKAKTDAEEALQEAEEADERAAQAAADLVAAKQRLAEVRADAEATEEELAEAEADVERAQLAADEARASASKAAASATQAAIDAATAQTAADNAKNAADKAKDTADKAKDTADKAKEDVDALAVRVTTAETKITQSSEQIQLMATKTEVTETLGGYYTKDQADAAISVKANEINSNVTQKFDALQINGRNLLLDSANEMSVTHSTVHYGISSYGQDILALMERTVTISFEAKASEATNIDHYIRTESGALADYAAPTAITTEWTRYSQTYTYPENTYPRFTIRSNTNVSGGSDTAVVSLKNIKLEVGNKATEWSAAPEDIETRVETAESNISQNATQIASIVVRTETVENKFNDYLTEEQTYSAIDQKAQSITSTVSALTETVNNLGGRNYLLVSGDERAHSYDDALVMKYSISEVLESGRPYVLSFDAKTSNGTDTFYVSIGNNSSTVQRILSTNDIDVTSEYKRFAVAINSWTSEEANTIFFAHHTGHSAPFNENNTGVLYVKNIKLEKGNKSTDWTPAPEDTATVYATKSEVEQTANSIKSSVSEMYVSKEDATNTYATQSEIEQTANDIRSEVSTTYATKADLSNLEIGGRNLLLDTKDERTLVRASANITIDYEYVNDLLLLGDSSFVVSYDAKADAEGMSVDFYFRSSNGTAITKEYSHSITTEYVRYKEVIEFKNANYTCANINNCRFRANAGSGTVTVKNIKLEKGNKVTDWTPAPEDVQGDITTLSEQYSRIEQSVGDISSTVGSIETTYAKISDLNDTKSDLDTTKAALDNLEIGGRNLLLKSQAERTLKRESSNITSDYNYVEDILEMGNSTFTIAYDAKASVEGMIVDFYFRNVAADATATSITKTYSHTITTEYARYEAVIEFGTGYSCTDITNCRFRVKGGSGTVSVKNIKLEKGNIATDYTPAAEDLATGEDLDTLVTRVTTAESKISQNENNITATVNQITSLEIGGRNLLPNTKSMSGYDNHSTVTYLEDDDGFIYASYPAVDAVAWRGTFIYDPIPLSTVRGRTATLSLYARTSTPDEFNADTNSGLVISFALCSADSATRQLYRAVRLYTTELSDSWRKVSTTVTLEDSFFASGSGTIDENTRMYIVVYNYSIYPMDVKQFKLEFGDKATDWTPSPTDMATNEDISAINGLVEMNTLSLSDYSGKNKDLSDKIKSIEDSVQEKFDAINSEITSIKNSVELQITSDDVSIAIQKELSNGVSKVTTTTGVTVNEDGLKIEKSDAPTHTQITENGMSIYENGSSSDAVLTANNTGVNAKNLHATTYLIVGMNSRFEDYGNGRTGCFWIGG